MEYAYHFVSNVAVMRDDRSGNAFDLSAKSRKRHIADIAAKKAEATTATIREVPGRGVSTNGIFISGDNCLNLLALLLIHVEPAAHTVEETHI